MNTMPVTTTTDLREDRISFGSRIRPAWRQDSPPIPPAALRAARRALRRSGGFVLIGRRSAAGPVGGWIVTDTAAAALSTLAAALVFHLATAHVGSDGRPRWISAGNVLERVGQGCTHPVDRRALGSLLRKLRAKLICGGVTDVVQADRTRGLRLAAYPAAIVWLSATADGRTARRVRTMGRHAAEGTR